MKIFRMSLWPKMLNINQFCASTKDQVVNMSNKYEFRCHTTVHCPNHKEHETLLNPWVGGIGDLIWYSLAEQPNLCSILQFDVPRKTLLIHNKCFYSSAFIKLAAYIMWGAFCYAVCLGKVNFTQKNLLKNLNCPQYNLIKIVQGKFKELYALTRC